MSTQPPSGAPGFWTIDRVADALAPFASTNVPRGAAALARVWTDTRTVGTGDLFVALRGERFDAHDFVANAVAKGAGAVVVSRGTHPLGSLNVPVFEVTDTLEALGALGRYRRRVWGGPVVCVAGTNGKTSTKELANAALGSVLTVHATAGNLNNLVGVPLTLLAIPDEAHVAVIEMGTNQPGEVARLRAIVEPNITIITSVAEEHLEGLGDLAGVLREELSSCDGVDLAVVPATQPEVASAAQSRATRVVTVGLDTGDVRATEWAVDADGTGRMIVSGTAVHVPLRGTHNLRNAMLALAVAQELGVSLTDAARGIATMAAPPMRVNWERYGQATLINDAYNANPGSTRAALDLLVHAGAGHQRAAILGSMLELGAHSDRLHDEVARDALALPIDLLAGVGEFGLALDRVAPGDPRVLTGADARAVWPPLSSRLAPDAVILLKGSRGVRLERLIPAISAWAARERTA